mmetsp:Transcript_127359/g.284762  ORF Transcript_127359/g.284762 Transcript_127359/m.284762 type:complete len:483 (+) Transcript_127359:3-1451(+)
MHRLSYRDVNEGQRKRLTVSLVEVMRSEQSSTDLPDHIQSIVKQLQQACFWRVVHKHVLLRKSPSLAGGNENVGGILQEGQLVLAKASKNPGWLEVIEIDFQACHPLFVLVDGTEVRLPMLLEPEMSLHAILPHRSSPPQGGTLDNKVDIDSVRRLIAGAIPDLVDENPHALCIKEVSARSTKQRTYRVRCDRTQRVRYVKCDKPLQRRANAVPRIVWKARYREASTLFSDHGLAPPWLEEGRGWHSEADGGLPLRSETEEGASRIHLAEELGELLASVHELPTAWYREWRALLREHFPWMATVGRGSPLWYYADSQHYVNRTEYEALDLHKDCIHPLSHAGSRIVTCHGDLKFGNTVRSADGFLKCIDLEHACVSFAIEDIACAIVRSFANDNERRNKFVEAYLRAAGLDANSADVDDVIFDAMCYRLGHDMLRAIRLKKGQEIVESKLYMIRRARSGGPAADYLRRQLIHQGFDAFLASS